MCKHGVSVISLFVIGISKPIANVRLSLERLL